MINDGFGLWSYDVEVDNGDLLAHAFGHRVIQHKDFAIRFQAGEVRAVKCTRFVVKNTSCQFPKPFLLLQNRPAHNIFYNIMKENL